MNIILEGPDGSGKTTLAHAIEKRLDGWRVQLGEGPPQGPGEINDRALRYRGLNRTIFDRHPCVSQAIYAGIRKGDSERVDDHLVAEFYAEAPVLIYCRTTTLKNHVIKAYDTPDHLLAVEQNFQRLVDAYDAWALKRANIIYRIGDDLTPIVDFIYAAISRTK